MLDVYCFDVNKFCLAKSNLQETAFSKYHGWWHIGGLSQIEVDIHIKNIFVQLDIFLRSRAGIEIFITCRVQNPVMRHENGTETLEAISD